MKLRDALAAAAAIVLVPIGFVSLKFHYETTPSIPRGHGAIKAIAATEGLLQAVGTQPARCSSLAKAGTWATTRCAIESPELRADLLRRAIEVADRERWPHFFDEHDSLVMCTGRGVLVSLRLQRHDQGRGELAFAAPGEHRIVRVMPPGCVGTAPQLAYAPRSSAGSQPSLFCQSLPLPLQRDCR